MKPAATSIIKLTALQGTALAQASDEAASDSDTITSIAGGTTQQIFTALACPSRLSCRKPISAEAAASA